MTWTVYGKIKTITRASGSTKSDLEFNYDASGNRISKIEKPRPGGVPSSAGDWITTYYVRDAQGNIMTTYKQEPVAMSTSFKVIERNLFGSARLGTENTQIELTPPVASTPSPFLRTLGNKHFEAGNHLGNVLVVFTDKKYPRDDNSDGIIDYFQPEIIASNDYYPFGAPMDGRTFSSDKYRYGFNGQEKDDEISGSGNMNTAEFWQYDARLGRRWNIDPVKKPWLSDYSCFSENPILRFDQNGDDDIFDTKGNFLRSTSTGNNIKIEMNDAGKVVRKYLSTVQFQMITVKDENGNISHVGTEASNSVINNIAHHYYKGDAQFKIKEGSGFAENINGDSKNIYINTDKYGRTQVLLNNYNNLFSVIFHENDHRERGASDHSADEYSYQGLTDHLNVYFDQLKDPSFLNTTPTFQKNRYDFVESIFNRLDALYGDDKNTKGKIDEYRKEFDKIKNNNEKKKTEVPKSK